MVELIAQIKEAEENYKKVAKQRDELKEALQDLVKAYEIGMGKRALKLRIELAKDALKKVGVKA
jgi:hypothetical protein